MLTWQELEALREAGKLVLWLPSSRKQTRPGDRCLYMTPDVYKGYSAEIWQTTELMSDQENRSRRRAMRMVLERYCTGRVINIRTDMKELGSEPPRIDMKGFWEFRSGPPQPQTRLFGHFARPGAFVATAFRSRGDMPEGSWIDARNESETVWSGLGGNKRYIVDTWPVTTRAHLKVYLDKADD